MTKPTFSSQSSLVSLASKSTKSTRASLSSTASTNIASINVASTKKIRKNKIIKYCALAFFCFCILVMGLTVASESAFARGTSTTRNCRYTHFCSYGVITKDGVSYNVNGSATYTRKCGQNTFPSWGCDFVRGEILDRLGPSALNATWGLSCGNTHSYTATFAGVAGVCGSAANATSTNFPTSNICSTGTVAGTSSSATLHSWTCNGINGGINTSCTAPRSSLFTLSCAAVPTSGTVNSNVTFTATVSGTTTFSSSFIYRWTVNGIASTTATRRTFINKWLTATNTAQVVVRATRGTAVQTITCPFNRVSCLPGETYCGDIAPVASYACAPTPMACPYSACGAGLGVALDARLPAGGTLSSTTPSDSYISTNSLCGAGSVLKFVSSASTWDFQPAYSSWRWDCQQPSAIESRTCKLSCAVGEFYCIQQDKCVPDGTSCFCPLSGDPLSLIQQENNCVNSDRTCSTCGKVIQYFKMIPDEMEKNQNIRVCGGFWDTTPAIATELPASTTASRVDCNMKTATTSFSVASTNPITGSALPLNIANYTLRCVRQYQVSSSPGVWRDLLDEEISAKCNASPFVTEQ